MAIYRDEAVVLRTYKLGEADRIIVLYARGRGKIRAVAKGVRRTKSKFGSRLEPASIVHAQLYEGKNLDVLTQVELVSPLLLLRSDLDLYGRSAIILETVDQVTVDQGANPALYKLTVGALRELNRGANPLVVPAFVAKMLALEGVQPEVDRCVVCAATSNLVAFSFSEGGTLCHSCRRGYPVSEQARQALASIFAGKIRLVLDATPAAVAQELETLTSRMVEEHIERRLRSSEVLYQQLETGPPPS